MSSYAVPLDRLMFDRDRTATEEIATCQICGATLRAGSFDDLLGLMEAHRALPHTVTVETVSA